MPREAATCGFAPCADLVIKNFALEAVRISINGSFLNLTPSILVFIVIGVLATFH